MDKVGCWEWVSTFPGCCFACLRTCFGMQDIANFAAFQRLFLPQYRLGAPFHHKCGQDGVVPMGVPSPVSTRVVQDKRHRGFGQGVRIWEGI